MDLRSGFRFLLVVVHTLAATCSYAADELPRMWKVERTEPAGVTTTLYLLAITHPGSSVEHDAYFSRVVAPAFMKADVFELEAATVYADSAPACAIPLQGGSANVTLEDAKDLVRYGSRLRWKKMYELPQFAAFRDRDTLAMNNADAETASLSEYGLVTMMHLNAVFALGEAAAALPAERRPTAPVEPIVATLKRMRPDIPTVSLDKPEDIIRAYCESGDKRNEVLRTLIERSDIRKPFTVDSGGSASVDRTMTELITGLLTTGKNTLAAPDNETFVCGRTANWVARLAALRDGRTYFVAVGAAHLARTEYDDNSYCSGLQDSLKARGFSGELLR